MQTPFTELVRCEHPLQQSPMHGVATPELAGAVAAAGALGMLCEYGMERAPERMTRALDLAGDAGAVGMGFFGQWIDGDLENFEIAASWLRVVEVCWTEPDAALVNRAHRAGGALVAWQVGSVEDALTAEDAGCDFVVAQGIEAGGHVRGTTRRDELVAEVCGKVTVPVVAAGGIATAADVARAIEGGASAVRIGTRFVATVESGAHPAYIDALIRARGPEDTVLTTTFSGGWPDAPHRVLRSAVEAVAVFRGDEVAHVMVDGRRQPIPRFAATTPSREVDGAIEAMAMYAGHGVGNVTDVEPAGDLVRELVADLG